MFQGDEVQPFPLLVAMVDIVEIFRFEKHSPTILRLHDLARICNFSTGKMRNQNKAHMACFSIVFPFPTNRVQHLSSTLSPPALSEATSMSCIIVAAAHLGCPPSTRGPVPRLHRHGHSPSNPFWWTVAGMKRNQDLHPAPTTTGPWIKSKKDGGRDGASFTTGSQTQNVLGQVRCGEQATYHNKSIRCYSDQFRWVRSCSNMTAPRPILPLHNKW